MCKWGNVDNRAITVSPVLIHNSGCCLLSEVFRQDPVDRYFSLSSFSSEVLNASVLGLVACIHCRMPLHPHGTIGWPMGGKWVGPGARIDFYSHKHISLPAIDIDLKGGHANNFFLPNLVPWIE